MGSFPSVGPIWFHNVLQSAVVVGPALSKRMSNQTTHWYTFSNFQLSSYNCLGVADVYHLDTLLGIWRPSTLNRKCKFPIYFSFAKSSYLVMEALIDHLSNLSIKWEKKREKNRKNYAASNLQRPMKILSSARFLINDSKSSTVQ